MLTSCVLLLVAATACSQAGSTPFVGPPPLTFVEAVRGGEPGTPEAIEAASFVIVSPDGKNVYVTESGIEDELSVFSRDAPTGGLTFLQVFRNGVDGVEGLDGVGDVVVSSDGRHVYTASFQDLGVFTRDTETGLLTFVRADRPATFLHENAGVQAVEMSPDARHVYTAVGFDGVYLVKGFQLLEIFDRDAASGDLTAVQNKINRQDGVNPDGDVEGLYGTTSIVISPDGRHLYTAAYLEDAVSVFSREETTGELTFVQVIKDGNSGANGLEGAVSVTVSPNGRHIYVTSLEDDALTVFARDEATGSLTFLQELKDGKRGIDGLDRAWSVAVSPNGMFVYAVGLKDNALVVFARESATGLLTPAQLLKDGVDGVDGLEGAISVAVSPDGRHVYAVGERWLGKSEQGDKWNRCLSEAS